VPGQNNDSSFVPRPLRRAVAAVERSTSLDRVTAPIKQAAERVGGGRPGSVLRGDWLGHALHPLLTDFPLGCWLSAGLLDIAGSKAYRPASRKLVGLGVLFAVPTALAGMADYAPIEDPRAKRVGAVHMLGNTGVLLMYLMSWRARRKNHHWRGVGWAMAGGSSAWITGYLGGHLSFARRVGTGQRGMDLDAEPFDPLTNGDSEESALLANGAVSVMVDGREGFEGPNPL
jgi:uncharacterized membrane protein